LGVGKAFLPKRDSMIDTGGNEDIFDEIEIADVNIIIK
jgi:hypothetical protein